jgi:hypothetical protein
MSDVIGRPKRYQQVWFNQFKQQFLARGATESFAQGYVAMYRSKDEGMHNVARRTLENTAPTSFRTFCEQAVRPLLALG